MRRSAGRPIVCSPKTGTKMGASSLAQFLTFILDPFSGGRSLHDLVVPTGGPDSPVRMLLISPVVPNYVEVANGMETMTPALLQYIAEIVAAAHVRVRLPTFVGHRHSPAQEIAYC